MALTLASPCFGRKVLCGREGRREGGRKKELTQPFIRNRRRVIIFRANYGSVVFAVVKERISRGKDKMPEKDWYKLR